MLCCPRLMALDRRNSGVFHGRPPGEGSTLHVGCWIQPILTALCCMAVKDCGSSPVVPHFTAVRMLTSLRPAWQHVSVSWRLCTPNPFLPWWA